MPDDIIALRSELFATLRALRNPENPLDVDTARAVVEVGKAIIDSARVEVEMTRITGQQSGSGFVPLATPEHIDDSSRSAELMTSVHLRWPR